MPNIKELSRRIHFYETERKDENKPSCTAVVEAEIKVDHDGKIVCLHGQWASVAGDMIVTEANEESLYDVYIYVDKIVDRNIDAEDFSKKYRKAAAERDRIERNNIREDGIYQPWYDELEKMIREELEKRGYA